MSRYSMTAERALKLLQEVADQRLRWGKQTAPPYTMEQVMQALELVTSAGWLGVPKHSDEDIVLLKRQFGALKSRTRKMLPIGTIVTERLLEKLLTGNTPETDDAVHSADAAAR